MYRSQVLTELAAMIEEIHLGHPVRVGIDGVDASGKTMLADEVVKLLREKHREVIRVSVDGFHNPSEVRYRQGRGSPQGYYDDSFNYESIISGVLKPLGPGGNLRYRSAMFDFISDSEVSTTEEGADSDAILLFDGIFLHRPELLDYWDFSVFVLADFEVTLKRAQERDLYLFKTEEKVREAYEQRYIPGEMIYLESEQPSDKASVVWDNNVIGKPVLTVNSPANKVVNSDCKSAG